MAGSAARAAREGPGATARAARVPRCYATGRRGLDQVGRLRGERTAVRLGVAPLPPLRPPWATSTFAAGEETAAGALVPSRRSQVPGAVGGPGCRRSRPRRGSGAAGRRGAVSVPPCPAAAWAEALRLAAAHGRFSPPHPELVGAGRRGGPIAAAVVGRRQGDIGGAGGRRSGHHAGVAGALGGAAAAGRERRDRAAARGRRGAHPAAVPAVPGADAGAGDPERAPQRLHVVLDPLALLAQLGHGAGPLPLPRPFGLDGRGAGHPPGRRGIGASSRQRTGTAPAGLRLGRAVL